MPSLFTEKRDRILALARDYPIDRILASFRTEAGLPTGGARPPGGWDDATGLLRGHYSGHFLSMLAQACASTGEAELRTKLDGLVSELGRCQDAMTASGRYSHPGYLAGYPEDQFSRLEQGAGYPSIWAPWYTCHKILAGLLDSYRHTGNVQALDIAVGLGRWAHHRLSGTTAVQRQRMWASYIAGESGGMNESLAELATLTGDAGFLTAARWFDNDALLDACAEDRDVLDGLHANQHIPTFLGYLELFEASGEDRYRSAAVSFWDMVVPHRMYSHGGTGQLELFPARGAIAGSIVGATNAETCACYNLLKLARRLFFHTADPVYLDYYERGLYNQILGSRQDRDSPDDPLVTYMVPVGPGAVRDFGNLGTCCGGTGLESLTKLQDTIYAVSVDDETLYVNLFVPSVLDWRSRSVTITQTTDFPSDGAVRLVVAGSAAFALALRIPLWADGARVRLNGRPVPVAVSAGRYLVLHRTWATGDVVELQVPLRLRVEATPDDPELQTVFAGPLALTVREASTDELSLQLPGATDGSGGLGEARADADGCYALGGLRFRPLHLATAEPYHLYLRRAGPTRP